MPFARATLYYAILIVCSIPFVPLLPLLWVHTPSWWLRPVIAYLDLMAFLLKHVCGLSYRVEGLENIPEGPVLFASQHESSWEVLWFIKLLGNPVSFAKREVFSYLVGGRIATLSGHLPIDRDGDLDTVRAAFSGAAAAVRQGRSVLIFPSGTRSTAERDHIATGVSALYSLLDVPCVPVLLDSGRCWPRKSWAKHPGLITVRILPPIPRGMPRRLFSEHLREALAATATGEPRSSADEATGRPLAPAQIPDQVP